MRKILLFIGLFSCTAVYAQCQTSNVYTDIECYEKQLKIDKSQLNKTYNKLYSSFDDEGKSALEASQKAWLVYRDKECNGLAAYFGSQALGAGSRLITLSCEAEKTSERVKALRDYLE
ncbi:uncharacterized protein YecT (DUF1311 family) [Acinetobacter calcoaceticus]|uniref:Uncharacterized protein YecT (DUF1311 family) n=1 Tax=Acinetobacter calcoaceticus TaxID=471 RepID=A0A4R1Y7Z5_ACICA|nr:uncharacterized protein YecT (DUF1311 family) [Acinetobacter calcoaceticus]